LQLQHSNADGYITLAKKGANWRQYHYKAEELGQALQEWTGMDVYFSINTFYIPFRRVTNVRQLRAVYADVDCYLLNFLPEYTVGFIEEILVEDGDLPTPNFYIFSGQGVCPIWRIQAVPYQALPLWQSIQDNFIKKLKAVGSDPRARDAARVFRVAGTKNSKNNATVTVVQRHEELYDLKELRDLFLPKIKEYEERKKKGRKPKIVQMFNIQKLHHSRLLDLEKLCEMRGWQMVGYREFVCFLRRYWLCCFLDDPEEALEDVLSFNKQFLKPLSKSEIVRATKSAEKAWLARSSKEADRIAKERGYPGAGYNYSNAKLIEELDITEDEQKHLRTIIDQSEKNRRRRESRRGRDDGLTMRERSKLNNKEMVIKLKQNNPNITHQEIADKVDVSRSYVTKILGKK